MTPRPWVPWPKAGDIVQCRFPQDIVSIPGPKARPGLVLEVEEDPDNPSACFVLVAYGTSQNTHERYPGEFVVPTMAPKAGLSRDTKFDLGNTVRLPFDESWFAPAKGRNHPKRGVLDIKDLKIKRALQAALMEAKSAGRL